METSGPQSHPVHRQVSKLNPHFYLELGKCVLMWNIWWQFPSIEGTMNAYFAYFCLWEFCSCILGRFLSHSICLFTCGCHTSSVCPCSSLPWKLLLLWVSLPFLMYLCPLFYFAPYCVELNRILNSRYLKSVIFCRNLYSLV